MFAVSCCLVHECKARIDRCGEKCGPEVYLGCVDHCNRDSHPVCCAKDAHLALPSEYRGVKNIGCDAFVATFVAL